MAVARSQTERKKLQGVLWCSGSVACVQRWKAPGSIPSQDTTLSGVPSSILYVLSAVQFSFSQTDKQTDRRTAVFSSYTITAAMPWTKNSTRILPHHTL